MSTRSVHIAAVSARTPLGLTAETSAAAVRAGLDRFGEHPFMIDHLGEPVVAALDGLIAPDLLGVERLSMLARAALRELCAKLLPLRESHPRLSLILGLPEPRPGWTEADARGVAQAIAKADLPFVFSEIETFSKGHAAGLMALQLGFERIRNFRSDICIIGGVDSYLEPDTLDWLQENRQLKCADTRSAFVPGEGAGFCALMPRPLLRQAGLTEVAEIRAAHTADERNRIKTDTICLGWGLTEAVRRATRGLSTPREKVVDIICDINGERYRAEEWAFAILRCPTVFVDATAYDLPATNWGDVGAASGPLFMALAFEAARRGRAKGRHTLIWASSEGGQRSAALLELNIQDGEGELL